MRRARRPHRAKLPLDEGLRHEREGMIGGDPRYLVERDLASLRVWHALKDVAQSPPAADDR